MTISQPVSFAASSRLLVPNQSFMLGRAGRAAGRVSHEPSTAMETDPMDRLDTHIRAMIDTLVNRKNSIGEGDLRPKAAWALGQIGADAKAAVPMLIEALKDANEDLRTEAACALQYMRLEAKAVVPALIVAMEDTSPRVRNSVINALCWIRAGKEAVPALIRAMAEEDDSNRKAAGSALTTFGVEAVPDLIVALKDRDIRIRRGAVWALLDLGGELAWNGELPTPIVPALIQALRDKDDEVREGAAFALGRFGTEARSAAPALTAALKDKSGKVRALAAQSLLTLGVDTGSALTVLNDWGTETTGCVPRPPRNSSQSDSVGLRASP
jgi:HEAT repeat protein